MAKAINISICACGKFFDIHNWRVYKEFDEVILKKVKEVYPAAKVMVEQDFVLPGYHKDKKEIKCKLKIKKEEFKVPLMVRLSKCNLCEKEGGKYFESTIQLRCDNPDVLEAVHKTITERVASLRTRGLFINKTDELDNGYDFYMTSNKLSQVIARELIDHFGGKMHVTAKLFSKNHQTSKELFRVSVLLEIPSFGKGDCVVFNDKVYYVQKLGKKMTLVDTQTNSSLIVDYPKECKALPKHQAYVSKNHPYLEVINPHDYQSSMVKNKPKKQYSVGESVDIVIHKGIYLVE